MNTALQIRYDEPYNEEEKLRYRDFLKSQSNNIMFEDDTWICDKRIKSVSQNPHNVSIYFKKTPAQYKDMLKYYAVIRLERGISIKTACSEIGYINIFLNFTGNDLLINVNIMAALAFKEYIDEKGYAESTRFSIWSALGTFFRTMNGYDGLQLRNPFCENFYESHKLIDSKYIPDDVAIQLDRAFMTQDIPLHLRCIYWLLRLIPSRISEILGMKINSVKPFDGHFCIFIPSWKQNGGYREPIMRAIHVNNEGMGGYLLTLICEQQKAALSYQKYLPDDKRNALFAYRGQIILKGVLYYQNRYAVASWVHVSYSLKQLCMAFNIHDKSGKIYCVTSHQFRHNGITDRLRAGFTLPQIAEMTGHHGTAMIYGSYAHLDLFPETLVEPREYTTEKSNCGNPYVLFGGKILNMDVITESNLLSNLRAHRVPGGICADVTHCKSDMWSCLECKHFVPEKEQMLYFKEQVSAWEEKSKRFKGDKVMSDNFLDIANRFKRIIEKIQREDVDSN